MKKALALFIALLLVCSFAACGQGAPATTEGTTTVADQPAATTQAAAADLPKSITYVDLGSTGMSVLKEAAAKFKADTGVEVKLDDWAYSDAYQKILTLAEAHNMPDAMYGFSNWTKEFKEASYIVPVEDFVSKDLYNDFSKAARDVCSIDGKMWTMPSYMSLRTVLFNKNLLDAANVSVPTTWQGLLDIAPKLCNPSKNQYAYSLVAGNSKNTLDCFLPILWAYGADITNADGTANGFNNDKGAAALDMYAKLAKYSVPDYGEATIDNTQSNFTNQVAAAYFHNAQGLAALKDAGKDYSWAVVVPPLAGPDGQKFALGVMDIDLLFSTGNQATAAKFLEMWHTKDYQGLVVEQAGWVTNQTSILNGRPSFTDPKNLLVAPFAANVSIAKFKPSFVGYEQVEQTMANYVTKAVMGEMSAKEAFAAAGTEVDKILAKK